MFSQLVPAGAALPHPEVPPLVPSARPLGAIQSASSTRGRDISLGYHRGPLRYPRAAQVDEILRSTEVQEVVRAAAPGEAAQIIGQVRTFAERMLPNPDCLVRNLMGLTLRSMIAALYDGLHISGADEVRALGEQTARAYVASHAGGHADYLFQNYALAQLGFRLPLTVASEHLDTPGVGPLLRRCGALFVKRGGEAPGRQLRTGRPAVYRATLGAALGTLLRGGWDLLVFPEGGPSVDGRPRRIRIGFLRELVRQARRGLGRPVALVPVNLRHDRHFEEDAFLRVAARGSWRGESSDDWRGMLRGLSGLRRHYGTLHMNFGRARLLGELVATEDESDAAATARVAAWVGQSIQAAAPLTAASLAAVSLVPAPHPLGIDEVVQDGERVAAILSGMAPQFPAADAAVPLADRMRALRRIELVGAQDGRLVADAHQRARLTVHRNLALPRLVVPSMVCRSILAGLSRPAAIAAAWQDDFPRIRDKLHLTVTPAELPAAVETCLRGLAAEGVVCVGQEVVVREEGRALAERLADAFDLARDVDGHLEIP